MAMLSSGHKDTDHLAKDKSKGHKGKRDEEKEGVGILHQGQPVRVSRHLMQKNAANKYVRERFIKKNRKKTNKN